MILLLLSVTMRKMILDLPRIRSLPEKFSQRNRSKKRRSTVPSASDPEEGNTNVQKQPSHGQDDDDGDPPLPPITQKRTSGRMARISRRDEELFEYHDPR